MTDQSPDASLHQEGLPVIILRDEKAAEKINEWGLRASYIPDPGKLNGHFGGDDVVLIPTNTDDGFELINIVGAALAGQAKSIRVVMLPDQSPGDDLAEWINRGGTAEQLSDAIKQARDWIAPLPSVDAEEKARAQAAEQQLIDELARLNDLDYDRRRKVAADDLGVNTSALDRAVRTRRNEIRETEPIIEPPPVGHWVVEPWDDEVVGDALLTSLVQFIKRFMVITDDQAVAIALWIVMTWAHGEAATHSPVLLITSAVPGEGKTQLLGLVSFLACRGLVPGNDTPASIYQDADAHEPTLCIDEADEIFRRDMRTIINRSWTKNTASVTRGTARGKTRRWSIWCPKVFGMIGRKMDASTLERCIIIQMKKKLSTERVEKFRQEDSPEFDTLRRQYRRWTIDNMEAIKEAAARIPDGFGGLENRAGDNWTLQFAIAHLAGGDWPAMAEQAAVTTDAAHTEDDKAVPIMVLGDIVATFKGKGVTKFHSDPFGRCPPSNGGATVGSMEGSRITSTSFPA